MSKTPPAVRLGVESPIPDPGKINQLGALHGHHQAEDHPHLWYDKEAKEAAQFYCSVFPDSKVNHVTTIHDTPSGDCDIVSFTLLGQSFMAISAGPLFKFNESVSFMVSCDTQEEIDRYWAKLSADPKSEQCGWLKDKYGLSWQITPSSWRR
jgi:predicted 3-demethylubiquinone-9 3-methyltransferase (glyoxalase superfamily)